MSASTRPVVIFDMDGVISDTERLHVAAEAAVLSQLGIDPGAVLADGRYAGVPDRRFFSDVLARCGRTADVDAIIAEKWAWIAARPDSAIAALPGALPLIDELRRSAVPLALASSSPRPFIDRVVRCLGLGRAFDVVVSADDVSRGKPDPEIFLAAARRLGVPPAACIVIEDSANGRLAARRAGMTVVAVAAAGADADADLVVADLRSLTGARLMALAQGA